MQLLSPVVSIPPSGAVTRELLTGTTYAARTEGSGVYRMVRAGNTESVVPAAASTGGSCSFLT